MLLTALTLAAIGGLGQTVSILVGTAHMVHATINPLSPWTFIEWSRSVDLTIWFFLTYILALYIFAIWWYREPTKHPRRSQALRKLRS